MEQISYTESQGTVSVCRITHGDVQLDPAECQGAKVRNGELYRNCTIVQWLREISIEEWRRLD